MESETEPRYEIGKTKWEHVSIVRLIGIYVPLTLIESAVVYPLYSLKTRLQTSTAPLNSTVIRQAFGEVGLRGLYKGFWMSTIGEFGPWIGYLMMYQYCSDAFDRLDRHLSISGAAEGRQAVWVSSAAGACAEIFSCTLSTPVDVVVQRMQVQDRLPLSERYRGGIHALRTIWARDGLRGLYVGYSISLFVSIPSSALWWSCYEVMKAYLSHWHALTVTNPNATGAAAPEVVRLTMPAQIAASWIAGIVTAIATNPLEIVRARIQTTRKIAPENIFRQTVTHMQAIAHAEGARGFGRGLAPRLAVTSMLSPFFSFAYEFSIAFATVLP